MTHPSMPRPSTSSGLIELMKNPAFFKLYQKLDFSDKEILAGYESAATVGLSEAVNETIGVRLF